nr:protein kinase [Nocardia higoensis]
MVGEPAPGTVFAGFTIERLLGAGGMGSVYLAAHPRIPKKIALKVLHRSLTHDRQASVLFEREADHAARLDHPNIVSVLDRGREDGQLWIAMQYVAGTNAAEAVARARLEPARAVHIIGEIAKALDYAHENHVLHRDVKPANMLLEEDGPGRPGRVLLADFGIAKALAETAYRTKSGTLVASLHYAAPEQFEGTTLDGRTDVYSLGCSLFHLLTGEPPYPGDSLPQLMHAHLGGRIPAPSWIVPDIPAELDRVVARAMAKDRADRYPTCSAFADAAAEAVATSRRRLEPTRIHEAGPHEPTGSQWTASVPPASPITESADERRAGFTRSRKWLAAAGVVLAVSVATLLVAIPFSSSHSNDSSTVAIDSTTMRGADGVEYTISGSLLDKYSAANASQKADLGPPLGAEKANPDGKYQWFVGGVIIQKNGSPAHIVWGEIRNKWNELGGSQGALGYPTSDEIEVGDAKVSTFEKGSITFEDGVVTVR